MSAIGGEVGEGLRARFGSREMKFASDMAKGEAKDPSEMWELIAYVKLQWGCAELVLLPEDHRTYIDTGTGILSAFELICGGDNGGATVVYCWKGSPRGLSAKYLAEVDARALGTNPGRIAEQAPLVT